MEKIRNNGVDLLRILAMCGIIGLHVLNNGGILENLSNKSFNLYSFIVHMFMLYIC